MNSEQLELFPTSGPIGPKTTKADQRIIHGPTGDFYYDDSPQESGVSLLGAIIAAPLWLPLLPFMLLGGRRSRKVYVDSAGKPIGAAYFGPSSPTGPSMGPTGNFRR
jgi:hypothetical protein